MHPIEKTLNSISTSSQLRSIYREVSFSDCFKGSQVYLQKHKQRSSLQTISVIYIGHTQMENCNNSHTFWFDEETEQKNPKGQLKLKHTEHDGQKNALKNQGYQQGDALFKSLLASRKRNDSSKLCFSRFMKNPDPSQVKYKFNKDNLLQIFFRNILSSEVEYTKSEGENSNFSQFFYYLLEQISYIQKMGPQGEKIMKMRSYILRQAMDEFCQNKIPQNPSKIKQNELRINKRMNKKDMKRYTQTQLPIPPSRMKNQFINRLFQNQEFKKFYLDYVKTENLRRDLQKKSIQACEYVQNYVYSLLNQKNGLEKVIKYIQSPNNSPLFHREIYFYLRESQNIAKHFIKKGGLPERPRYKQTQLNSTGQSQQKISPASSTMKIHPQFDDLSNDVDVKDIIERLSKKHED